MEQSSGDEDELDQIARLRKSVDAALRGEQPVLKEQRGFRRLLTASEAAKRLGVTEQRLYQFIDEGRLLTWILEELGGQQRVGVSEEDLAAFLQSQKGKGHSGGVGQRKEGAAQDIENRKAMPRYVIPKATRKKFGSYVRRHREQANLSLAAVAKQVGVHETFIAKIEIGERTPHPDKLSRLAVAIGVTENDLRKILGLDELRPETVLDQVAKLAAQITALRLMPTDYPDPDDRTRRQEFLRTIGHALMSFERAIRLLWPKPPQGGQSG